MYIICDVSFTQNTTNTIKCPTGNATVIENPADNDNIAICSETFEKSGQYVKCNATFTTESYNNLSSGYVISSDSVSTTVNGVIKGLSNYSSNEVMVVDASQDLTLNGDFMQLMLTESFWFLSFGIFLGAIMGMMRKSTFK